jgi:hypothetical protein
MLKLDCVEPGSTVFFYTLSGERVNQAVGTGGIAQWDGKNRQGAPVSSGIYFYVVMSGDKAVGKGKFLVIH